MTASPSTTANLRARAITDPPSGSASSAKGTQRERVQTLIFQTPAEMARRVARRIAMLIEERQAAGETAVLGLPTGSTPIGVYQELIRMHEEEGLDFSNVVTFNLDEYYPMASESLQSYHLFMEENFFKHVNVAAENIHIPQGDIPRGEVDQHCLAYEHAIEKAGGIDLQLLGIGRSGHVGFNEPGSGPETRTRLIILDEITRKDAASGFFGEENVPREAITMGVGTILDASEIILMATGEHKAPIVSRAIEEAPTREVTASYLQGHPNATFYLDTASAGELTRIKTPWIVKEVEWDVEKAKRAVIWLSKRTGKPILRLETSDFHQHQLHALVHRYEHIDRLAREVFEDLRQRVTYPEEIIAGERVIVFSPHPDDDVISMGGMLDVLAQNENDVTAAYMTNGSVAVFDADVQRYLHFLEMSTEALGLGEEATQHIEETREHLTTFSAKRAGDDVDPEQLQVLKAHVRYSEAIAAIGVMGLGPSHARFLDMPFYKTGRIKKDPIGEVDVDVVLALLREVQPGHIFVAGDLSDPHGTHRMCYQAIKEAVDRYHAQVQGGTEAMGAQEPSDGDAGDGDAGEAAPQRAEAPPLTIWLYRGAWQEWETHRADLFLPLSKAALDRKVEAIFKHESQKDRAMFPGAYDEREFWQRARDRNRETANTLNDLGLPEFYAAEAYVVTDEMP